MISVSLLPYLDIFIGGVWNLSSIPMNRFANAQVALWTLTMCVAPLLILAASRLNPYWLSYIIPIYVYISMLLGYITLEYDIKIDDDYVFRGICLILSVIILFLCRVTWSLFQIMLLKEEIENELKTSRNE